MVCYEEKNIPWKANFTYENAEEKMDVTACKATWSQREWRLTWRKMGFYLVDENDGGVVAPKGDP